MPRLKSSELGYYIPSFFEMHINTDCEDLTINKLPLKDMTVLFHEYIHFLQDFTTYYGLNSVYCHCEYLRSVVNRVYKINNSEFPVPFVIRDNEDNVLLNRQLQSFTQGDDQEKEVYVVKKIIEDYDTLLPNDYFDKIPNIILNPDGDIRVFGAIAIMESMAYIMERLCSPNGCMSSPDYPYKSAELVANYYVDGFSENLLMVLALCDTSLQSSNPGHFFVKAMQEIREGKISFSKPEEIYDYYYEQENSITGDKAKRLFVDIFKNLLSVVKDELKSYLQNIPYMEGYSEWIDHLADFAIKWRETDRYFILRMASVNDLSRNDYWGFAVYNVGTPLMVNNKGDYFKIPQNQSTFRLDVELFSAIRQIESLFELGITGCDMYDWCEKSDETNTNNFCNTSPWKRCTDDKLCPYALLWRHWALTGREPKKQI